MSSGGSFSSVADRLAFTSGTTSSPPNLAVLAGNGKPRMLTDLDHVRLLKLARRDRRSGGLPTPRAAIEHVLDACAVVPSREIPPDVVTMYSQVLLQDLATGLRSKLTLCYPAHAQPAPPRSPSP